MARLFIIIPALDAAAGLPDTLASLEEGRRGRLVAGGVLADGGSSDATREIARAAGFKLVTGAKGRGPQLIAGAEAAGAGRDDWYLFLHADTRLEAGWSAEVRQFMQASADRDRAAAFRFALDDPRGPARRLTRFVNWRSTALKLPYGDQGLIISRRFYESLGGFKPIVLFEDVDMVRRIGGRRLSILRSRAVTSAARFEREGYLKRSAKNLVLLSRYYLGADPARLAKAYSK